MPKPINPFVFWASAVQVGWLALEAQAVITMRLWGMAGLWPVAPSENRRMVAEKADLARPEDAAAEAADTGQSPAQVIAVSFRPTHRKTRANARRLSRRGPQRR